MEIATAADEMIIIGDFNLPAISWRSSYGGFLYPDHDRSTFHSGAVSLLDHYSIATLKQINHVVNENNRSLDLCFVTAQDTAPHLSMAVSPLIKTVPHHPPLVIALEGNQIPEVIPPPLEGNFFRIWTGTGYSSLPMSMQLPKRSRIFWLTSLSDTFRKKFLNKVIIILGKQVNSVC